MMIRDSINTLREIFRDINIAILFKVFEERINNISNKCPGFKVLFLGKISKDIIMKKIKLPFFHEEIQKIMDNFPQERDKGEILDYLDMATGMINKFPQEAIGKNEFLDCLTKIFIPMRKNRLGQKIKNLRKQKGLTQEKLAPELNISKEHLCNIEKGRRLPRLETMHKITQFFDIEYNELLDISEDTIEGISSQPLTLTDEQMDRYLASAVYSNNPMMLEDAILEKQNCINQSGISFNLKEFINNTSLKNQLSQVKKMIRKSNFSLFFLSRELTLHYISQAIGENNLQKIYDALKAVERFLSDFPEKEIQDPKYQKIHGAFIILYELCCHVHAIIKNNLHFEKSLSESLTNCIPITSDPEKSRLIHEYKEKTVKGQNMNNLRKTA